MRNYFLLIVNCLDSEQFYPSRNLYSYTELFNKSKAYTLTYFNTQQKIFAVKQKKKDYSVTGKSSKFQTFLQIRYIKENMNEKPLLTLTNVTSQQKSINADVCKQIIEIKTIKVTKYYTNN